MRDGAAKSESGKCQESVSLTEIFISIEHESPSMFTHLSVVAAEWIVIL